MRSDRWIKTKLVCSLMLIISSVRCWPTPIVYAVTGNGFIIGTNDVRSDASRACKLHYSGRSVLILAGQPVAILVNGAGRQKTYLDLDGALDRLFATHPSGFEDLDPATKIISHELAKTRLFPQNISGEYHLILFAVNHGHLSVKARNLSFSNASSSPVRITDVAMPEKVGQIVHFGYAGPEATFIQGPISADSVGLFLKLIAQKTNLQEFGPPFIVVQLSQKGLEFLSGDASPCNRLHFTPLQQVR